MAATLLGPQGARAERSDGRSADLSPGETRSDELDRSEPLSPARTELAAGKADQAIPARGEGAGQPAAADPADQRRPAEPAVAIQGPGAPFGAEHPLARSGPWPRRRRDDPRPIGAAR